MLASGGLGWRSPRRRRPPLDAPLDIDRSGEALNTCRFHWVAFRLCHAAYAPVPAHCPLGAREPRAPRRSPGHAFAARIAWHAATHAAARAAGAGRAVSGHARGLLRYDPGGPISRSGAAGGDD